MAKESMQSKGGKARAKALSGERRKQIATTGALARWDYPKATHFGELKIGNTVIECAVLNDGRRVLTQAGFLRALGRGKQSGLKNVDGTGQLPAFMRGKAVNPYISNELLESSRPIIFIPKQGGRAFGYKADILPLVCEAFLAARRDGALPPNQIKTADKCEILVSGLANIGIIALVDEATGYQVIRDRVALQAILDKYITDRWAKWTKTFPNDYYRELFRLKGLNFPPNSIKRPQVIGHWTNDIVYKRLAPGVLKELRRLNPVLPTGHRKRKFFQYLTKDIGNPALREHIVSVIFLMKACTSYDDFLRRLDRAAPRFGDTIPLEING